MSVKKMGSKLAQGVRQVKAQQSSAPVEAEGSPVPAAAKPARTATRSVPPAAPAPLAARVAPPATPAPLAANVASPAMPAPVPDSSAASEVKPATADKTGQPGALHPDRVWPD